MSVVVPVLIVAVLATAVGVWLVVRGALGVTVMTAPRCRACGFDLRTFAGEPPVRCNECGADLGRPNAVLFGTRERRPRAIFAGLALVALAALVVPVVRRATAIHVGVTNWPAGSPAALPSTPTPQLLAQLPANADRPWHWNELKRRLANNALAAGEVDAAVDAYVLAVGGPQGRSIRVWADDFVRAAEAAGRIDPRRLAAVLRAEAGPPPVAKIRPRLRAGEWAVVTLDYGAGRDLRFGDFVKAMRAATIDGGTATLAGRYDNQPGGLNATDGRIVARVKVDAPPGPHTLTLELDAAVLPQGGAPSVDGGPGPASQWPVARAKWAVSVPLAVTVVADTEPTVDLVTDPALDPAARRVTLKSAKVTRGDDGPRVAVDLELDGTGVAQAYAVSLRAGGRTHRLGTVHVAAGERGTHGVSAPTPGLAAVTSGEIVLTPAPDLLTTDGRIWGGTVTLAAPAIVRYDLQAATAPVP